MDSESLARAKATLVTLPETEATVAKTVASDRLARVGTGCMLAALFIGLLAATQAKESGSRALRDGLLLGSMALFVLGLFMDRTPRYRLASTPLWRGIERPVVLLFGLGALALSIGFVQGGQILPAAILWLAALAISPLAFWTPRPLRRSREGMAEAGVVVAILLVTVALRFYALGQYPTGIHGDEAELGLLAVAVLQGKGPNPFGLMFLGDPALFSYVSAAGIAVAGQTIEAIRGVSAVFGLLSALAGYWLTREMFGRRAGLIALVLFSTNHILLHFSRFHLNVPEMVLFSTLGLAALWAGAARRRGLWFFVAGLAGGMSIYFNFPTRLLPFVYAALFLVLSVTQPPFRAIAVRAALLTLLGGLVAFGPAALKLSGDPGALMEHSGGRYIFSPQNAQRMISTFGTDNSLIQLWGQIQRNVLALINPLPAHFYPSGGDPMVVAPLIPVAVLGLALAIFGARDPRMLVLLVWCIGFLIPGVLSIDAPQTHRIVLSLVGVLVLAAALLDRLIGSTFRCFGRGYATALSAALAALLVVTSVEDARAIFVRSASVYPWADLTLMARTIAAEPPGTRVFVVGAHTLYAGHGTTRYLAGQVGARDLFNLPIDLRSLEGTTEPLTFLVNAGLKEWGPAIKRYFPGGQEEPLRDGRGNTHFVVYRLPATQEPRRAAIPIEHGLAVSPTRSDRAAAQASALADPYVAYRNLPVPQSQQSVTVTWRGLLQPPSAGDYTLEVFANGEVELLVDGAVVIRSVDSSYRTVRAQVRLRQSQPLELRYTVTSRPAVLDLMWRRPGGERELIPPEYLRPVPGG